MDYKDILPPKALRKFDAMCYLDPRGASTFSDMKQIDVPSENSPNPYAAAIQNELYKNDKYNYKQLYGNTPPPPVQTQNNTQPTSGYPELRADKRNTFNSAIESFVRTSDTPQSDKSFTNQIVGTADDFRNDMAVNVDGRQMAQSGQYRSAYEACDKYRPAGYDPLDRFRYYKK